ncbi:MAG: hypothetical protein ACJ73U_37105, partial [Actinophytocola sp.]
DDELARVHQAAAAAEEARGADRTNDDRTNDDRTDSPSRSDERAEDDSAPLAADPGPLPSSLAGDPGPVPTGSTPPAPAPGSSAPPGASSSSLASAPGPLPFDMTARTEVRPAVRGALATAIVAFLAVLFFFAAAGGGFALSRYVGGEPLLPPSQRPATSASQPSGDKSVKVIPRTGSAAALKGDQGGGFSVPVPEGWVQFVEQVPDEDFVSRVRVYYVSPDGTQVLTVERLPSYYPGHNIEAYVKQLESHAPDVTIKEVYKGKAPDIPGNGVAAKDTALDLDYRATISAKELAPDDPAARDLNRETFARLLPHGNELWVVSVTVPVDQESTGQHLSKEIIGEFQVAE